MGKSKLLKRMAIALSVLCVCAFAATATVVAYLGQRGAHPSPFPSREGEAPCGEFPEIDWIYWQQINPRVIGWITIPGTRVNNPIVQASIDDPSFYLFHDIYDDANFTGCPFLDAGCIEEGGLLRCPNSVVYGHNMGWSQDMFGDLEFYADRQFAEEHKDILLQTPEVSLRLKVQAATVIPGESARKRIDFLDDADFDSWWKDQFSKANIQLAPSAQLDRNLLTLCTCSYSHWNDERTLIYCMSA